jgi:hypothetical protein
VTRRIKVAAYVVAWLAALIATNPGGDLWSLVWMFPLGLVVFFHPASSQGGWFEIIGATVLYVVHGVFYFRARSRRGTILLYALLIALLFCNVAGCRHTINAR